jgi:hypothetical protein
MRQVHDYKGFVRLHRAAICLAAAVMFPPAVVEGQTLAKARELYNLGRYEAAIEAATAALAAEPDGRHAALVVLGRSELERFRQTADPADLSKARESLREVDASRLDARDRVELLVGLGQALFLDDLFLSAADLLESALPGAPVLGASARDQLLDWWASALDRHALLAPADQRPAIYDRILSRMEAELALDPGTGAAAYWMAVAARAKGELDRAWSLAQAGWVRAQLTRDRGAALRPDLDRLVRQGIVPDRAHAMRRAGGDFDQATTALLAEWEAFVAGWTK